MTNRDPDVRFFVRYAGAGATHLIFQLIVRDPALGPTFKEYGPCPIYTDTFDFQAEIKRQLGNIWTLAKRGGVDADDAKNRLAAIGINLFQQLPEPLQDRFRSFLGLATTLQIISDEPTLPWELMKLKKKHGPTGPFLGEEFAVTRWLPNMIGNLRLPINDIALVIPGDSGLKEAEAEKKDMQSLAGPERRVQEIEPTKHAVTEALRSGEHDAWHFCGHGTANSRSATNMGFKLLERKYLQPVDLGECGQSLGRRQPLVFMNACETGVSGVGLMDFDGWARAFLAEGAGAFLGTLWPVDDVVAREFAQVFYQRFLGGEPIAEALLQARIHVRDSDKFRGDPSWLAYTLFAHPFASAQENQARSWARSSSRKAPGIRPSAARVEGHTAISPDIRIQVQSVFRSGETHLEFSLDSPSGVLEIERQKISDQVRIGSPEEYRTQRSRWIDRIEKLNDGLDFDNEPLLEEHVQSKLEGIGRDLYLEFFPAEIQEAYRSFRKRGLSLMFVTDESWIPWELVKPYDDSDMDDLIDDDFLCLKFPMTRWLGSASSPAEEILVRQFAFLGGEAFPRSKAEREQLHGLAGQRPGVKDVSPNEPTMAALEDLLVSSSTELLHFASPFVDRTFRPEDLHGPRASQIKRNRPLVLFNYESALEGWERRWIKDCGCGAFVGFSWPPQDSLAYEFVSTFYDALGRGQTFGYSALEARRRLYALRPGIPAWFAYTVYAHVNGRLVLGGSGVEQGDRQTSSNSP